MRQTLIAQQKLQRAQFATNKCVIYKVSLDVTEEKIKDETKADLVKRFVKRGENNTNIPTGKVILGYKGEPPGIVYIGYTRFCTTIYIPKPIRCNHCHKYGHTKNCLNHQVICSYCGGKHIYEECHKIKEQNESYCINWKGNHSAAYRECRVYKDVEEALYERAVYNITFKEAYKPFSQRRTEC